MNANLTPWFPYPDYSPTLTGVYKVKAGDGTAFAYFDTITCAWGRQRSTVEDAYHAEPSPLWPNEWCGLAEPPAEQAAVEQPVAEVDLFAPIAEPVAEVDLFAPL